MNTTEQKLMVLSKMAAEFNRMNLIWAVGGSLLLYLKGYTDHFNDIDIMVAETDAEKMEGMLKSMGSIQPTVKGSFETRYYRKFIVDSTEVDMVGGFAIVNSGHVYNCDLEKSQIAQYIELYEQRIPLHSIELWRKYYALMGRDDKAAMIDAKRKQ